MARFTILTFLGVSTLCVIGIPQANAQSQPVININALVQALNTVATSGDGGASAGASLVNINLLVQLLNGLITSGNSGIVGTDTLTDICNRACTSTPPSSNTNTDSLIAIRIIIELLNAVARAGNAGSVGVDRGSLVNVNVLINLLNIIAGGRSGETIPNPGVTRPLIGIDVLLQALNNYRLTRIGGGGRLCNIDQLNQRLHAAAANAGQNSGSVLDVNVIAAILNGVVYRSRAASPSNSLIRVNVLIDALNQLLGGEGGRRAVHTGSNALVSIDVGVSLLNNCSRSGGGLLGLVGNLLNNLLGGLLGHDGLLGRLLGGPGGLGGLLNGLLGGLLG